MSSLSGTPGFPTVLHYEPACEAALAGYLLMELLGPSLESLLERKGGGACVRLGGPSLLCVGRGVVHLLRRLHLAGYVHNDVKPANLLLGRAETEQPTRLHLIDFGSCSRVEGHVFPADDNNAPPYEPLAPGPIGTLRFASVAAEERSRPMRPADDLESLVYTLTYLAAGSLPWQGQPAELAASMKQELLTGSDSAAATQLTRDVRCATAAMALQALWLEVRRCHGDDEGEGSAGADVDYEACVAALSGQPSEVETGSDMISERTLMAALETDSLEAGAHEAEAQEAGAQEAQAQEVKAREVKTQEMQEEENDDDECDAAGETPPHTSSDFESGRVVNVRISSKSNTVSL